MKMIKKIVLATFCASAIATTASADYLKKGDLYVQIKGKKIAYVTSRELATNFTIINVTPSGFCGGAQYHVQTEKNYVGCTPSGDLAIKTSPVVWSTPFYFGSNPNALNACNITLMREK